MNGPRRDLFLRPLEPVLFGEPRPFNAGEAHRARSQFPPSPQTFQGILRSHLLRAVPGLDLTDRDNRPLIATLVGDADALPRDWQMRGPLPARLTQGGRLQPWAPAPRFLYRSPVPGKAPLRARPLVCPHPAMGDLGEGYPAVGRPDLGDARPLEGWLAPAALAWALTGAGRWDPAAWGRGLSPFVYPQPQPGVALERDSNRAADGMLYLLEAVRFAEDAGLWGRLDGPWDPRIPDEALAGGVAALGRKARLGAFEPAPPLDPDWLELMEGAHLEQAAERGSFWLYLLTPAPLAGHGLAPPLRSGVLPPGIRLGPCAAFTGPSLTLGGLDLARDRMRPNRSYIPAGSGWLCTWEGDPGARPAALRALHDSHPLEDPGSARFGFGHTLVGTGPRDEGESHE